MQQPKLPVLPSGRPKSRRASPLVAVDRPDFSAVYLPGDGSSPLAGPSPHYLIHGVLWLCPRRSIGAVRFPLPVLPCGPPVDLVVSLAASGCVPRRPSVARPQVPGVPVIVALSARLSRIASRPVWIGRGLIGDAKPTAAACVWWSGLQMCQGCSRASCALRRRPFSSRAHWRLEMSGSVRRPPNPHSLETDFRRACACCRVLLPSVSTPTPDARRRFHDASHGREDERHRSGVVVEYVWVRAGWSVVRRSLLSQIAFLWCRSSVLQASTARGRVRISSSRRA